MGLAFRHSIGAVRAIKRQFLTTSAQLHSGKSCLLMLSGWGRSSSQQCKMSSDEDRRRLLQTLLVAFVVVVVGFHVSDAGTSPDSVEMCRNKSQRYSGSHRVYTLCLKKVPTFKLSVTLSNLNLFSKFLHCCKAYEICYKTLTTLPTSP